ncbi:hypothetical protein ACHAWF_002973 [Thalassiosira exigua]
MLDDLPSLFHRRRALAATALVVAAANLALISREGDGDGDPALRHRHLLPPPASSSRKTINLHYPYAPHEGNIEDLGRERDDDQRRLTVWNTLEDGSIICEMAKSKGPTQIDPDATYQNTIVVGYPGGDKRTIVRQMEALTGLSGRDAWDFKFLGMTKQPYIKTNYPHHEGIWAPRGSAHARVSVLGISKHGTPGWQDHADQVMLVVRNIRQAVLDYHDILSDIDYAKTWSEATEMIPNLYAGDIKLSKFERWRDERIMDEIGWYGWLIDYWMEGGILRDYFDHKLTTKEHWAMLRAPETWTYGELQWDVNICETDPLPEIAYDDLCDPVNTADCRPKVVVGAERFMDPATGPAENRKVAELLNQTAGISDELVNDTAWDCFYDLLIANNTDGLPPENSNGYHDYRSREGDFAHVLSTRHLNKMIQQLTRLIDKYSAFDEETQLDWANTPTAQYLVEILAEHRTEVQAELEATSADQNWAHPPKPNWVVFPKCGADSRRVWDYDYPHEFSGYTYDMFPEIQ